MIYAIFANNSIIFVTFKALIITAVIPAKSKGKTDDKDNIDHLNHEITDPKALSAVSTFYLAKIIGIFVSFLVFLSDLSIYNIAFQCSRCPQVLVYKVPCTEHTRAEIGQNLHHL